MCESFAAMAAKPLTCAVIDRHRFRVVPARVLSTAFQSCNRMCLSGTRMWWLRGDGCVATHMCLDRSESKSVRDCCESRNPRNSEDRLSLDIGRSGTFLSVGLQNLLYPGTRVLWTPVKGWGIWAFPISNRTNALRVIRTSSLDHLNRASPALWLKSGPQVRLVFNLLPRA